MKNSPVLNYIFPGFFWCHSLAEPTILHTTCFMLPKCALCTLCLMPSHPNVLCGVEFENVNQKNKGQPFTNHDLFTSWFNWFKHQFTTESELYLPVFQYFPGRLVSKRWIYYSWNPGYIFCFQSGFTLTWFFDMRFEHIEACSDFFYDRAGSVITS